ncbi:MAG: hypothetical protein JKY54_15530 [Flavobacteriales bacterium]|nr:hypothetical protein [Flavobacteriales bacterium]
MYYKTLEDGTRVLSDSSGIVDDVIVVSVDTTLRVEDSGKTFMVATDALTITLPSTVKGVEYTFMNSGADGNNIITVSPAAADGISGTATLAATVVVLAGVVDKDLINTKASSITGDTATIVATGTAGTGAWLLKGSAGIWAAEA